MKKFATGLLLIVAIALMLLMFSCAKKVVNSTTTTTSTVDSTFMEVVHHYDTVKMPGDKVIIREFVKCDSLTNKPIPFKVKEKSGRVTATVVLNQKGDLEVLCKDDSLQRVIDNQTTYIHELRKETSVTKTDKTVEVFKTRKIDIICRWISGVLLVLIIVGIVLKVKKLLPF